VSKAPVVKPLQVLQLGEVFEGDIEIPQEIIDSVALLEEMNRKKIDLINKRDCLQISLNVQVAKQALNLDYSHVSSSTLTNPQPEASSFVLDILTPHMQGELPSYQHELQKASKTVPEIIVSKNQQQTQAQLEIAPELCTTLIIHPLFKLDSPLDSASDTTIFEQVVSEDQTDFDKLSLVSED